MKKYVKGISILMIGVLLLSGCTMRRPAVTSDPTPTVEPTAVVTAAPVVETTPEPTAEPTPTPIPEPTATPEPTPEPTPIPTSEPTMVPGRELKEVEPSDPDNPLPVIKKNPTDEAMSVGESCWFTARYENAKWAEWHLVSPDGTRDLTYQEAKEEFPEVYFESGDSANLNIKNAQLGLDGWRAYCRFYNSNGTADTKTALITVVPSSERGYPIVTKQPTSEVISDGGACSFIAHYKNAIWAEWRFVNPDRSAYYSAYEVKKMFPGLSVSGSDSTDLVLNGVPRSMDGWSVYCCFTNNVGTRYTDSATINVTS